MPAKIDVLDFLSTNVKPASGCTEIAAVAFVSSSCYYALSLLSSKGNAILDKNKFEKLELIVDKKLFKNAYGVTIPNTGGRKGIDLAATLGLCIHPGADVLEIFKQITPKKLDDAISFTDKVTITIDSSKKVLFIKMRLYYDNHTSEIIVNKKHDTISSVVVDGNVIFVQGNNSLKHSGDSKFPVMTIEEMLNVVENISTKEENELQRTIDFNMALAKDGLSTRYGMGITPIFLSLIDKKILSDDVSMKIRLYVVAAVEARMGGSSLSAMSTSGSGNMGITASIPIIVAGNYLGKDKKTILKALLLSHLITRVTTNNIGELSIFCGVNNKSAFGAAAGLTYLLGGEVVEIKNAINAVASNIMGSACDGAKHNCALKAMTSSMISWDSALLCTNGLCVLSDGIVDSSALVTLDNLSKLSKGMSSLDDIIIDIIKERT